MIKLIHLILFFLYQLSFLQSKYKAKYGIYHYIWEIIIQTTQNLFYEGSLVPAWPCRVLLRLEVASGL